MAKHFGWTVEAQQGLTFTPMEVRSYSTLISKAKHSASNPTWPVEDTPPLLIARSLCEPTRQDSSPSGSWCDPFSTLDDEALAASLGRLDEYFAANPRLIFVPPDVDQLSSPSHSTFGACMAIYQQSHTMNNMEDYSQSIHSNTALLFSPSSSSSQSLPSDAWLPITDPTARHRYKPIVDAVLQWDVAIVVGAHVVESPKSFADIH
ncbi:hypothetical protein BJ912DRAFT_923273 [Pholiota molesta]|nr:hypothetical protein BJ912DRAFT_923273 [Pholiota molesta]